MGNTHYKSSYFLKGVMKMADIDPFGEHDKTDSEPDEHPDETKQLKEDPLGNQHANKIHLS